MKKPLREIFELLRIEHDAPTPECKALEQENSELWEQVYPVLGRETIDKILNSYADLFWQSEYEWFLEGLRLGVALMLEAGSFPA